MGTFGTRIQNISSKLIRQFGKSVTVTLVTNGAYDASIGGITQTTQSAVVKAVPGTFKQDELTGLIQSGDQKYLIAALDLSFEPDVTSTVTVGTTVFQVVNVGRIEAEELSAVYVLTLRK